MSKFNELADKLHEQAKEEEARASDIQKLLDDWRLEIQSLFGLIEKWFIPLTSKGVVTTSRIDKKVTESPLDKSYSYDTQDLIIDGNLKVRFKPVGRFMIGSRGQVDIEGIGQEKIMLNHDSREEGGAVEWFITEKTYDSYHIPRFKVVPLTEDTLAEVMTRASKR